MILEQLLQKILKVILILKSLMIMVLKSNSILKGYFKG